MLAEAMPFIVSISEGAAAVVSACIPRSVKTEPATNEAPDELPLGLIVILVIAAVEAHRPEVILDTELAR